MDKVREFKPGIYVGDLCGDFQQALRALQQGEELPPEFEILLRIHPIACEKCRALLAASPVQLTEL